MRLLQFGQDSDSQHQGGCSGCGVKWVQGWFGGAWRLIGWAGAGAVRDRENPRMISRFSALTLSLVMVLRQRRWGKQVSAQSGAQF